VAATPAAVLKARYRYNGEQKKNERRDV
jgi:hypothetical protein